MRVRKVEAVDSLSPADPVPIKCELHNIITYLRIVSFSFAAVAAEGAAASSQLLVQYKDAPDEFELDVPAGENLLQSKCIITLQTQCAILCNQILRAHSACMPGNYLLNVRNSMMLLCLSFFRFASDRLDSWRGAS